METKPEPKVLTEVTTRVCDRFPDVPRQRVADEVSGLFEKYADSRVRDFVPILVERAAVDRLRRTSGPPLRP